MLKGTNIPWVSALLLGVLMRCRGIFPWDFMIFYNVMSLRFKSFEIIFQQFQLKTSGEKNKQTNIILLVMIPSWEVTYRIPRHFWRWISFSVVYIWIHDIYVSCLEIRLLTISSLWLHHNLDLTPPLSHRQPFLPTAQGPENGKWHAFFWWWDHLNNLTLPKQKGSRFSLGGVMNLNDTWLYPEQPANQPNQPNKQTTKPTKPTKPTKQPNQPTTSPHFLFPLGPTWSLNRKSETEPSKSETSKPGERCWWFRNEIPARKKQLRLVHFHPRKN